MNYILIFLKHIIQNRKSDTMNKKQAIIDETIKLFSEHGYNLSLSELAKSIGLKKQSIYNYYASKDELIKAVLNSEIEKYYAAMMNCVHQANDKNPRKKLFGITRFIVDFFSDASKLKIRKWISLSNVNKEMKDIQLLMESYELHLRQIIRDIIEEGIGLGVITEGNIERKTDFYVVIVRGLVDGLFIEDKSDKNRMCELVFNDYWNFIKKV